MGLVLKRIKRTDTYQRVGTFTNFYQQLGYFDRPLYPLTGNSPTDEEPSLKDVISDLVQETNDNSSGPRKCLFKGYHGGDFDSADSNSGDSDGGISDGEECAGDECDDEKCRVEKPSK